MTDHECPVCGATEKSTGAKFDSKSAVVAHMSSSKGEHTGIGYQKAKAMLNADEEVNGEPDEDAPGDVEPQEDTNSQGDPPDDPTMGDATPEDVREVDLPCGHESFDPAEVNKSPPFNVQCTQCGQEWSYNA
jgi:hypothetical protein